MYYDHVLQADQGADLDFLVGKDTKARNKRKSLMNNSATFPDLKGSSVFITGGGSGIGGSITEGFLRQGAKVSFVQRSDASAFVDKMEETTGIRPFYTQCDITDVANLKEAMDASEKV